MLTSQDVVSAYRLVLGREPESAAVIQNYVAHSDFDQLRTTLLSSVEFAERVSRNPTLLAVPMVALTMTAEVCRYQSLLEALVSFALPIWDRSVLIVGDEPANLAGFFLDRRCKVSLAVSDSTAQFLRQTLLSRPLHAANISIVPRDFTSPTSTEPLGSFDIIYGELPDNDPDVMRAWLDNAAEACTDTLIVICRTAPGRSEDLFVTPMAGNRQFRTIPTKKWLLSRLRERFAHAYDPTRVASEVSFLQGGPSGSMEAPATFVGSRTSLSSPALIEFSSAAPSRSPGNGSVAPSRV